MLKVTVPMFSSLLLVFSGQKKAYLFMWGFKKSNIHIIVDLSLIISYKRKRIFQLIREMSEFGSFSSLLFWFLLFLLT